MPNTLLSISVSYDDTSDTFTVSYVYGQYLVPGTYRAAFVVLPPAAFTADNILSIVNTQMAL